jgi:hypothetical protein
MTFVIGFYTDGTQAITNVIYTDGAQHITNVIYTDGAQPITNVIYYLMELNLLHMSFTI